MKLLFFLTPAVLLACGAAHSCRIIPQAGFGAALNKDPGVSSPGGKSPLQPTGSWRMPKVVIRSH